MPPRRRTDPAEGRAALDAWMPHPTRAPRRRGRDRRPLVAGGARRAGPGARHRGPGAPVRRRPVHRRAPGTPGARPRTSSRPTPRPGWAWWRAPSPGGTPSRWGACARAAPGPISPACCPSPVPLTWGRERGAAGAAPSSSPSSPAARSEPMPPRSPSRPGRSRCGCAAPPATGSSSASGPCWAPPSAWCSRSPAAARRVVLGGHRDGLPRGDRSAGRGPARRRRRRARRPPPALTSTRRSSISPGPLWETGAVARGDGRLTHDVLPGEKGPQDACGVFGVWAPGEEVAKLTYFGLYALQHRGQESAGIAVSDGTKILVNKDMGLVAQVFDEGTLQALQGSIAVGHTRYSTTGGSTLAERAAHPGRDRVGTVALSHNGNLVNVRELRDLVGQQYGQQVLGELARGNTTDTALVTALLAGSPRPHTRGDGARGPAAPRRRVQLRLHGRAHPLRRPRPARHPPAGPGPPRPGLGGRERDGGARHRRRLGDPRGRAGGVPHHRRRRPALGPVRPRQPPRLRLRVRLPRPARHHDRRPPGARGAGRDGPPARAGTPGGRRPRHPRARERDPRRGGLRAGQRHPVRPGLVKNAYVGRTFIQPSQTIRQLGIRLKLNPLREVIRGRGSSSSTTRSCAATPSGRSCGCSARPAPPRCTCGSRARR